MQRKDKRKDAISGMKDGLYSRAHTPEVHVEERTPLATETAEKVGVGWSDGKINLPIAKLPTEAPTKDGMSFGAKFLIGASVFFVGALGVAGYIFFVGGNTISSQNIDIQVIAPSIIDGGSKTTFEVIVNNRNQSALELVDLSVDYPDNTRDPLDPTRPLTHELQPIGSIKSGEQIKRTANAVLYGKEGSPQKIVVTLQYAVPNSNGVFKKQAEADFTIGSSPISISVQSPAEAISDQQFAMDITVTSNATAPLRNVALEAQYPFGFTPALATPPPEGGTTLWRLGSFNPGQSKKVHIEGKIVGQDGDDRVFRFLTGADISDTDTRIAIPFIQVPQTLTVHRPFITATLALERKTDKTVSVEAGKVVSGVVTWQNNLTVPVSNMQALLKFSGPMLDTTTIRSPTGFYQSQSHSIIWTKDQDGALDVVPPGGTGTFSFEFQTVNPGSGGKVYANPTVNLELSVSGVRQGQTGVPENISSAATIQATIASAVTLDEVALHFTGPFSNTGPMPPIAEQHTTYTILWTVKNSSNSIANTVVSTILPPYVQFVQGAEGVTYEKASRTVTWSIGELKAGAGFSSAARTVGFQVSLQPSASQIGLSPQLTGFAKLSGQDRFAQVLINTNAPGVSTRLDTDTGYTDTMGAVSPK